VHYSTRNIASFEVVNEALLQIVRGIVLTRCLRCSLTRLCPVMLIVITTELVVVICVLPITAGGIGSSRLVISP
jgi:hypothetical protein